jgi:hypothetical protein
MAIAVTRGTGNVGRPLVEALVAAGARACSPTVAWKLGRGTGHPQTSSTPTPCHTRRAPHPWTS